MNGLRAPALALAAALRNAGPIEGCDLLACPPATVLALLADALAGSHVMVGGQDCHAAPAGPHTGDVSASMLRDAGATAVIVGHSERRQDHGETDRAVRAKAHAAQAAGLLPIVCVGETEQERLDGRADIVVGSQLLGSVPEGFIGAVAYEPVWAIGTGRTPADTEVADMHAAIRQVLLDHLGPDGAAVRILYGGSVKAANVASLLALPEVGGALVGGASLMAADFIAIARAASTLSPPAASALSKDGAGA